MIPGLGVDPSTGDLVTTWTEQETPEGVEIEITAKGPSGAERVELESFAARVKANGELHEATAVIVLVLFGVRAFTFATSLGSPPISLGLLFAMAAAFAGVAFVRRRKRRDREREQRMNKQTIVVTPDSLEHRIGDFAAATFPIGDVTGFDGGDELAVRLRDGKTARVGALLHAGDHGGVAKRLTTLVREARLGRASYR